MRPPFRYTGGKQKLAPTLASLAPKTLDGHTYYEPFSGAGALFFHLQPKRAVLGDLNRELITTYYALGFDYARVELELHRHAELHRANDAQHYYLTRAESPTKMQPWKVAGRFLYLNRAGFNGLYRLNQSGQFNTPLGDRDKPVVFDFENLRACSQLLQKALSNDTALLSGDYRETTKTVTPGDFVYLDPPYVPVSKTASFTAFTKDGFSEEDQLALAAHFRALAAAGVHVMASNSDTAWVREAYKGFKMVEVTRQGTMSSKADGRGRVGELVILGGTW